MQTIEILLILILLKWDKPVHTHSQERSIQADIRILHRLISANEAHHNVKISEIMMHKLLPVPLDVAEIIMSNLTLAQRLN